ncbi:P-loop containing nucleoside triphosphate hydrolase protein, partial [Mycena olivaceomarginata]
MLPSEPKIFHGRESEVSDILHLFNTGIPRIAILGAGGMGKTSLARAVLHHPDIMARYVQNRFFVACNSATTKVELVNLIGSHLGLKPGENLTQEVLQYFTKNPPSLLILDELETLWEPASSRANIEELLSLLTGVEHLALLANSQLTSSQITMRGAEHPAKVQWTRPFLKVLQPLDQEAARHTFVDIADSGHSLEEVDQILSLADNMPLAISLLAHLADTEGCFNVLSRWEKEKTSMISEGFDKRSNLDMSISLSLSSPRIQSSPHSQDLLSILAMLPDGLADVDLIQSKLPLENILKCKTALKSTALAYSDEHKRLKVLMPIQEYLQQHQPPGDHLVQSLFKYFQEMLEFYLDYVGTQSSSSTIPRIKSNFTNIQNVLQWGLKQKQPTLSNSIYCVCYLSQFSQFNMQVHTPLIGQIQDILPQPSDHRLEAYFLTESIRLWRHYPTHDTEALASQVLELFKHFDDPDLKCKFYFTMSEYYLEVKNDFGGAANMCKELISFASQTGDSSRHISGLCRLAWINLCLGKYSAARMDAHEGQKLSRGSGYLHGEAHALRIEAICWKELGHYKQSLSLSIRAQSLLSLCGMAGSHINLGIMNTQAEIHKCKSEYSEAWKIQTKILQISTNRGAYWHAVALLNLAEIAVSMGVQKQDVQGNIELPKSIFTTLNLKTFIIFCDTILADLYLREKDLTAAKRLFKKCLKSAPE